MTSIYKYVDDFYNLLRYYRLSENKEKLNKFEELFMNPYLDGVLYLTIKTGSATTPEKLYEDFTTTSLYKNFFGLKSSSSVYGIYTIDELDIFSKLVIYKRYIRYDRQKAKEFAEINDRWKDTGLLDHII